MPHSVGSKKQGRKKGEFDWGQSSIGLAVGCSCSQKNANRWTQFVYFILLLRACACVRALYTVIFPDGFFFHSFFFIIAAWKYIRNDLQKGGVFLRSCRSVPHFGRYLRTCRCIAIWISARAKYGEWMWKLDLRWTTTTTPKKTTTHHIAKNVLCKCGHAVVNAMMPERLIAFSKQKRPLNWMRLVVRKLKGVGDFFFLIRFFLALHVSILSVYLYGIFHSLWAIVRENALKPIVDGSACVVAEDFAAWISICAETDEWKWILNTMAELNEESKWLVCMLRINGTEYSQKKKPTHNVLTVLAVIRFKCVFHLLLVCSVIRNRPTENDRRFWRMRIGHRWFLIYSNGKSDRSVYNILIGKWMPMALPNETIPKIFAITTSTIYL